MDLNPVLVRCIVSYTSTPDFRALRLALRQFADVVDQFSSSMTISLWSSYDMPPPARLRVVRHYIKQLRLVNMHLARHQWQKLEKKIYSSPSRGLAGLPQLSHLVIQDTTCAVAIPSACAAHLKALTRLDISCPGTVALPLHSQLLRLKAASFACTVRLQRLVAFAPNLDRLWASTLDVSLSPATVRQSFGTRFKSRHAMGAALALAKCTQLGCRTITGVSAAGANQGAPAAAAAEGLGAAGSHATAAGAAASSVAAANSSPSSAGAHGPAPVAAAAVAAEAAACIVPNLKVLTCMPSVVETCDSTAPSPSHGSTAQSGSSPFSLAALGRCPALTAVRVSGNLGYTAAAGKLQHLLQLRKLTHLSLHSGNRCVSAFSCINTLSDLGCLQHVAISGSCRRPNRVALLLDQLAPLPQLQSLALPIELLCDKCSSTAASEAVQASLWNLVAHCSSFDTLLFLPGTGSKGGSVAAPGEAERCAGSCPAGSASATSRSGVTAACTHAVHACRRAVLLYSTWQAAAAFAGLSLGAAAVGTGPVSAAASASTTIIALKQQWQLEQQQQKQREHQQLQQQLQQLQVVVGGLPQQCCGHAAAVARGSGAFCDACLASMGAGSGAGNVRFTTRDSDSNGSSSSSGECTWDVFEAESVL